MARLKQNYNIIDGIRVVDDIRVDNKFYKLLKNIIYNNILINHSRIINSTALR